MANNSAPSYINTGLNLTHRLDERFGLPRKRTLSQRDVPGITSPRQ